MNFYLEIKDPLNFYLLTKITMSYIKDYAIDLENENKQLKEDRQTVWETACEMVRYIEDTDYIEPERINEFIATIQNFSN